jgi:hypothetical protein
MGADLRLWASIPTACLQGDLARLELSLQSQIVSVIEYRGKMV